VAKFAILSVVCIFSPSYKLFAATSSGKLSFHENLGVKFLLIFSSALTVKSCLGTSLVEINVELHYVNIKLRKEL